MKYNYAYYAQGCFQTNTFMCLFTGKYPYLLVKGADSEPGNGNNNHLVLLFGEVCLNTAVEKLVELINPLPVRCNTGLCFW